MQQKYQGRISFLKLINFLSAASNNMLRALNSLSIDDSLSQVFHQAVLRHCCYDRRKRPNFCEIWEGLA